MQNEKLIDRQDIQHQITLNEILVSEYTKALISMNSNKYNRNAELFMLAFISTLNNKNKELRNKLEEA